MNHYFDASPTVTSQPKSVQFKIKDVSFDMETDSGVFSKSGLDFGTRLLIETVLPIASGKRILDLGCGSGPIGIVMTKLAKAEVWMTDVNERAVSLTRKNCSTNRVKARIVRGDGFSKVQGLFDLILTNPPIRAGKKVYYAWFEQSPAFLAPEGSFIFVVQKKQGAPSAIAECQKYFTEVSVLARKSGYFVVSCRK